MCEEIDLSRAVLLVDSNRGVYVWQEFAQTLNPDWIVEGVTAEDWDILKAGPDHEFYWETADSVDANALIIDELGGGWRLYQDGDLWAIPV